MNGRPQTDDFLETLAKSIADGRVRIVKAEPVAPCLHHIRESKCIGTPDAQNLWQCGVCGKKWLR